MTQDIQYVLDNGDGPYLDLPILDGFQPTIGTAPTLKLRSPLDTAVTTGQKAATTGNHAYLVEDAWYALDATDNWFNYFELGSYSDAESSVDITLSYLNSKGEYVSEKFYGMSKTIDLAMGGTLTIYNHTSNFQTGTLKAQYRSPTQDILDALNTGDTAVESVRITLTDWDGNTTSDVFSVSYDGITTAPTATDDTRETFAGERSRDNVLDNDVVADSKIKVTHLDGVELSAGARFEGEYGTLRIKGNGGYDYRAKKNIDFDGQEEVRDVFTYTITDREGDTDTAELVFTFSNSDAPIARDNSVSLGDSATVRAGLLSDDGSPDGSDLRLVSINGQAVEAGDIIETQYGTMTIRNEGGSFTFVAKSDDEIDFGDDQEVHETLSYVVTNDSGLTDDATLTITVYDVI